MGFFSAVGGFVCSAISAVGGALSAAGSAIATGISSLCSSIGGNLMATIGTLAASLLVPGLGLPELLLVIEAICTIVSTVAQLIGVNEGEDTPEELGMKAEKADKKPDDFDSIEEYIKYLNTEVKLEDGEVDNLSKEDKVKYAAVGTAINIKAIEEKYQLDTPGEFWKTVADMKLSGEEVKTYLDTFSEKGIKDAADMSNYLRGNETKSNSKAEVSDALVDAITKLEPGITQDQVQDKLMEMEKEISM